MTFQKPKFVSKWRIVISYFMTFVLSVSTAITKPPLFAMSNSVWVGAGGFFTVALARIARFRAL